MYVPSLTLVMQDGDHRDKLGVPFTPRWFYCVTFGTKAHGDHAPL